MGHPSDQKLYNWLKQALRALYDPQRLKANPLFSLFGFQPEDGPTRLQNLLISTIQNLKPIGTVSTQSQVWRVYQILIQRFVDQFSQNEVANSFGISVRQYRRLERLSIETLLEQLQFDPQPQIETDSIQNENREYKEVSSDEELLWLQSSQPKEILSIAEMVSNGLSTLEPLIQNRGCHVENHLSPDLPPVWAQRTSFQQGLINLLTVVVTIAYQEKVYIQEIIRASKLEITFTISGLNQVDNPEDIEAKLLIATQLFQISDTSLSYTFKPDTHQYIAQLVLPIKARQVVMALDDNQDTLQLYKRYLKDSEFSFIGLQETNDLIPSAVETQPGFIFIDVMLPETDGWELLGKLREHPKTKDIPVFICTILPQAELALMLGASGFLLKPFNRLQLLDLLHQPAK